MRVNAQNHATKKSAMSVYGIYVCFLSIGLLGTLTHNALAQSADAPLDLGTPEPADTQNPVTQTPLRRNTLSPISQGQQNLAAKRAGLVTNSINRNANGGRNTNTDNGTAPGVSVGSFTLRPSIQTRIVYENEKTDTTNESRVYNQTTIATTLQSNWPRHSFTLSGTGTLQKNISGTLSENPSADINADLELNLSELLTANIRGGYSFRVEDRTNPNAIANATSQANINTFTSELALSKNVGIIRGRLTGSLLKEIHGDATLANNNVISGDDRNLLTSSLALRMQYAANPVLMPFIEGKIGRTNYDQEIDNNGVKRSYSSYALRLGLEADVSDKLAGEFAVGYVTNQFKDTSLANIDAFTIDSNLNWSPQRGTNVLFGFRTSIEPSTSVGVSGATLYALNANISHQLVRNVTANLGTNYSLRRFTASSAQSDQTIYGINSGIEWSINRYVSLNADASYTKTLEPSSSTIDNVTLGLGLTLTR